MAGFSRHLFFMKIALRVILHNKEVRKMGKDRQEKKLKASRRVESDRDQALNKKGATRLDTPDEARDDQ